MDKELMKSVIEAILFAWSDPISAKEIAKAIEVDSETVREILKEMMDEFSFNKRGIQIIQMKDHYQLTTRPEHYEYIQKLVEPKQNKGLTQAALETLAIIAYKQPITKTEIEEIRGVKCDKAIGTLIDKGLIEEQGRLEKTGRPIIYGTTVSFLKTFGLKGLEELPQIKEIDLLNQDEGDEDKVIDIYNK